MNAGEQAAFAAALLDAGAAPPAGLRAWNGSDPARRFGVHRNNVVAGLTRALGDTFPVLRRLVGAPFFDAMAGVYLRAHPPASPVLAHYGAGFADWLEGFAPARGLPWLPDMARLEFARVAACHAADAMPLAPEALAARQADAAALPGARLRLHPSCRVLRSRYAVHTLWAAHQGDGEMPVIAIDRPGAALVLRDADDEVLAIGIAPAAADFIAALLGRATLAEALQCAAGVDLAATLALLIRHGAIAGWQREGEPS